jgi:hypothetical protein
MMFLHRSAIFLAAILIPGCSSECWTKPGSSEYKHLVQSISVSNTVAVRNFANFSIDKQITIFLFARDCPDDSRIRPMLILDGQKKIGRIVERIKTEKKIWDKEELVGVLIAINGDCKCISAESEVIKTLESVGRGLDEDKSVAQGDPHKQMYHDRVNRLKVQLDREEP